MKRFTTLTAIIVIAMVISACGAEPVPTANPVDVQNTAVAAAATMVAQTLAAVPTATPLPPTETASPTLPATNTPVALPTLDNAILASPTGGAPAPTSSGDPCDTRPLGVDMKGNPTIIKIENTTKVPVTVSIYLNETPLGACGYRSYKLPKGGDVVIKDLVQGCYNIWAWSDAQGGKFNSSGYGCINNTDKWVFEVNTATVKFTQ
ncbi:MAG TPA: hypothetical protein VFQ13_07410 [Anaerolineales bacterium]|nr:hypothetical protein [Anaerolineales bacterium]